MQSIYYSEYKLPVCFLCLYEKTCLSKYIKFKKVDIKNKKRVNQLIKKFKIVYNFAAIADIQECYDNPLKSLNINVIIC